MCFEPSSSSVTTLKGTSIHSYGPPEINLQWKKRLKVRTPSLNSHVAYYIVKVLDGKAATTVGVPQLYLWNATLRIKARLIVVNRKVVGPWPTRFRLNFLPLVLNFDRASSEQGVRQRAGKLINNCLLAFEWFAELLHSSSWRIFSWLTWLGCSEG